MLAEQLIATANDAQRAFATEPVPTEIAKIGMELVRRVRAYAQTAVALETQTERLTYRLLGSVQAHQDFEARLRCIVAQWEAAHVDDAPMAIRNSASAYAIGQIKELLGEDPHAATPVTPVTPAQPAEKFRRPRGDFLRVFQGGAIRG